MGLHLRSFGHTLDFAEILRLARCPALALGLVGLRLLIHTQKMGEFSLTHIVILLVIVLIFFGPSKLPGLGKGLGEAIRGFKKGMNEDPPANSDPNRQITGSPTGTSGSTATGVKKDEKINS
jgi:TatA/E family protein of Tat protein translocase